MKILIVAKLFPPENSIASLRPYSWAKYWSRYGNEITVLTTSKEVRAENFNFDCSGFNIISIPLHIPFTRKKKYTNEFDNSVHAPSRNVYSTKKISEHGIKRIIRNVYDWFASTTGCFWGCRFPDWTDLWVKKAMKTINPNDFDVLVTTAWPYSVHRTGLYFRKKGWKGTWICDWRDSWPDNPLFNGLRIFHCHENKLLRSFLNKADAVTTVSNAISSFFRSKTTTPVCTIFNGMDEENIDIVKSTGISKKTKFTCAYTGSWGPDRTPVGELFFGVISSLLHSGKIKEEDFEIVIAGCDLTELIEKYNLEKICKCLGKVPLEEAYKIQLSADEMLFLSPDYDAKFGGVLSGKIFEYLYLANDIMAIGCTGVSPACKLIKESNSGEWFGNDTDKIELYLLERIKNPEPREKKWEIIRQFSREKQAKAMLDIIEKCRNK